MNMGLFVIPSVAGSNPGSAPVANWTCTNFSPFVGQQITFEDQSLNNPTSWAWFMNGSLFSNLQDPVFYCSAVGQLVVQLVVTNQFGTDNRTHNVNVQPL